MTEIQELIEQVYPILQEYENTKKEKLSYGEYFNIYSVLRLYEQEVNLHSRMIKELLNVKGNHGQKDAYLKAFIEIVFENMYTIDSKSVITTDEYNIGVLNSDRTEGGRIDILCESKDTAIIIENKIWAGDQEKQLLRYFNFAKSKQYTKGYKILYLTLDGHLPSPASTGNGIINSSDYKCISYKKEITKWIEKCIEISQNLPNIKAALEQYLKIINQLNGYNMDNELVELIAHKILNDRDSSKSIKAAFAIHDSLWKTKRLILQRIEDFQNTIQKEIKIICKTECNNKYDEAESGYIFKIEGWNHHYIKFSFADKYYKGMYYGIVNENGKQQLSTDEIKIVIENTNNYGYSVSGSSWWTCNKEPESELYRNAWDVDAFIDIQSTDNFKNFMKTEICNLLDATKNISM